MTAPSLATSQDPPRASAAGEGQGSAPGPGERSERGPGGKTYTLVFLVIIAVTLASLLTAEVFFAQTDPARLPLRNSIIFAIASVKAVLIAMFYMHLRYEPRPVHLVAAIPLLFMAFLVAVIVPFQTPAEVRLLP